MQSQVSLASDIPLGQSERYSGCRCTLSPDGTTVARQDAQKPALPARASSEPLDLEEIAEDSDFTVSTTKGNQSKTEIKPNITETAINTALPFSPTPESHVSGSSGHNKNQFITAPRQKITPVFIH
jgi:hypothetical protein